MNTKISLGSRTSKSKKINKICKFIRIYSGCDDVSQRYEFAIFSRGIRVNKAPKSGVKGEKMKRYVAITGASSGIGAAAKAFAKRG